jgi:hypothetical protein
LTNTITDESLQLLLIDSKNASEALKAKLATVVVPVSSKTLPDVIKAISELFGDGFIDNQGNSQISYDMYLACVKYLRTIGALKGEEYV